MKKWIWPLAYIGTIFAANWAVQRFGIIQVWPWPALFAPAGVAFAGLAFSLRDVTQEAFGRNGRRAIVACILIGAACSFLIAGAERIAIASGVAFLVSESMDWAVYEPLRRDHWLLAVAASNAVGLTLDSLLFLTIAFGWAGLDFLAGQIVAKLLMTGLAVALLYPIRKRREALVS